MLDTSTLPDYFSAIPSVFPIKLPWTRVDLADEFARHGFRRGAEIGVERGHFSKTLCQRIPHLDLICVDAWQPYAGYREHVGAAKLDGFYAETRQRLAPFNCTLMRKFSVEAAASVPDGSLDFVYIDAAHDYDSVLTDLHAWVPKVRRFGIVAGHDYGRSSVGQVKEAVEAWTEAHGIAPWYVLKGDRSPSWMWVNA